MKSTMEAIEMLRKAIELCEADKRDLVARGKAGDHAYTSTSSACQAFRSTLNFILDAPAWDIQPLTTSPQPEASDENRD